MATSLNSRKLRAIRRGKKMTQEQLAERAGLSDRHIRAMEKNNIDPYASTLYNICRALEVPMDELITTAEDQL